jgi:hypothetical protein
MLYSNISRPSKLVQAVTRLICIRKVFGSNTDRDTLYTD